MTAKHDRHCILYWQHILGQNWIHHNLNERRWSLRYGYAQTYIMDTRERIALTAQLYMSTITVTICNVKIFLDFLLFSAVRLKLPIHVQLDLRWAGLRHLQFFIHWGGLCSLLRLHFCAAW